MCSESDIESDGESDSESDGDSDIESDGDSDSESDGESDSESPSAAPRPPGTGCYGMPENPNDCTCNDMVCLSEDVCSVLYLGIWWDGCSSCRCEDLVEDLGDMSLSMSMSMSMSMRLSIPMRRFRK
jgi:hypothetical protein